MSDGEPFADIPGGPIPTDDDSEPRTRFVDWRLIVVLLVLLYVLILAAANGATSVSVQLPPFETEVGLVWLTLATLLIGGAVTLLVQAGYRGYRKQREALEAAAKADIVGGAPAAGPSKEV